MSIPDSVMDTYYELLLGEDLDKSASPVDAKRELGRRIVERFHPGGGEAAEAHFDRLHKDHAMPDEIDEVTIEADGQVHLPALLAEHFDVSRSEARRLLEQGGVKIEGEPVGSDEFDVDPERLDGAVLQVGKRKFRRVRVKS
jgi:tyrosyl-tRNA synthetase